MTTSQNIESQALSTAAEAGFESQLDAVETLDVDIEANAGDLVQGELESVTVEGEGLVMQGDLRAEALVVETDAIAINPLKAAFGDIELKQPTNATAEVTLTESDIERAFNSDFMRKKLRGLKLEIDGKPHTIDPNQITFKLPGAGKVELSAKFLIIESVETQQVNIKAVPQVSDNGHSIILQDVQAEGPESVVDALLDSATELLDLRNFELEGMSFRLQELEVQQGQLMMQATAKVSDI
ncbi:hypothetical protein C1752_07500 [Acaryochloris thomasi RCC1774]|uniref:DUF2993 domain-containing protein n=1 Tax=Acaryochloris thomasi RCC1774 TaxID=1764569 RepID=A0A2W1JM47_9CYAN|nr:DUF2993 domain-containing protein [Acaryochloris thomasi]PZD71224.1 hypothetical protein C1752_07500 [Acaryochloris thomasi RCC1774]